MRKVLMWSPNDLDGVSLYRHWGPLLQLEREEKIKIISLGHAKELNNWIYYHKADLAFVHRPYRLEDWLFIKEVKKFGLPLWVDMDDDLFNVPIDNDAYTLFASEETKNYMASSLKSADVVTVATDFLKNYLSSLLKHDNVKTIPNALDDRLLRLRNLPKHEKLEGSISWRGTRSHLVDLLFYKDEIRRTIESHDSRHFMFWGYNPFFITANLNTTFVRPVNFIDFINEFCKASSKVLFVPLVRNHFNQVKSNIAWIEGTLAGNAVLAPDTTEWQKPGILNYSERPGDFERKLNEIIQYSKNRCLEMNENSFDFIKNNLLLSKINNIRLEIINSI